MLMVYKPSTNDNRSKVATTLQKLGGPRQAKPESRERSARDLRAEARIEGEAIERAGEGSGEGTR